METDQKLDIGVGTEEGQRLDPKDVEVESVSIKQHDFKGKPVDQLVVMARHPDRLEPFQIFSISYLKNKSIKTVGLSIYYDSSGKLMKGTAIAELLRVYQCTTLKDIKGRKLHTTETEKGYLAIKAY